jgi:predicted Zn-dependent peptidase
MCKGDENSIFEFGYLEDLEKIDAKTVSEHYADIITKTPIDIFVVGDIDLDEFCGFICEYFSNFDFKIQHVESESSLVNETDDVRYVEDEFDVAQGKLAMGFTTNINIDDENYYGLLLANSIYGSGAHSRLFNTVREKMSLCYYASSMLDKFRGVMLVSSGIEFENYEKAKDEIEKQLKCIADGDFTDEELEISRSYIINSYLSYKDSPYAMKEYYRSQCFSARKVSIDEAVKKVRDITRDDVKKALSCVKLNTVYFLKGKVK